MSDDQIALGGILIYALFLAAFLYWAFTHGPDDD